MSQSVKERVEGKVLAWLTRPLATATKLVDDLAAAGLLMDERAQACVEACKGYRGIRKERPSYGQFEAEAPVFLSLWDAGAAYDAPARTQADVVADLVAAWSPLHYVPPLRKLRYEELLDELAALTRAEGGT